MINDSPTCGKFIMFCVRSEIVWSSYDALAENEVAGVTFLVFSISLARSKLQRPGEEAEPAEPRYGLVKWILLLDDAIPTGSLLDRHYCNRIST